MLTPISIKDALQRTAPAETILVQGWLRTRRDSKDFSFLELNDGSCLRNLQVIAKNTLPNYAAVQRLITGASIAVRGALVASQGKGQSWEVVADSIEIIGASDDTYPFRKRGTRRNSCARSLTCVRARIFSAAYFACAAASLSPSTNFFRNAVLFTCTRRSSPEAIAKAPGNCFASQRSTRRIRPTCPTARSTTPRISSRGGLISRSVGSSRRRLSPVPYRKFTLLDRLFGRRIPTLRGTRTSSG